MNSKKTGLIVIGVIVVAAAAWFMFSGSTSNAQTGRVVFSVKDAAEAVNATAIMITIDKVEVHSEAQGWVTVSTASKQYDLLKLKATGATELLADVNLPADNYNQIRLNISKASVTVDGVTHEAKLPSNTLRIVGKVVVVAGSTSTVTLDFIADRSLHITGNGKYILSPVVKLETRSNAFASISSDAKVNISGGRVDEDEEFEMDEKGETRAHFELDGDLDHDDDDIIKIGDGHDDEVTIILRAENNSGISGKATFEQENGKVKVELDLNSNLTLPEPAHIHIGVCPGVGAVKYALNSVVNGKSETTIDVTLAGLKTQLPLAVNVHKSAAEIGTYVACGQINI